MAVRAVAYRFDNSGYIQNVGASQPTALIADTVAAGGFVTDRDDVGGDEYTGFRITALWQPVDEFKATLMYLQQDIEQDGTPEVNYLLSEKFQQTRLQVGPDGSRYESISTEIDITNLVLEYNFDWGSVLSSSSKISSDPESELDGSVFNGSTPYSTITTGNTDVFIQEIRFSSNFQGPLQLLTGLYYEDRENELDLGDRWSGDSTFGDSDEIAFRSQVELPIEQKAIFGEMTYAFNEQTTATLGARHFEFERENNSILSFLGFVFSEEEARAESSEQSYKFNLSYQPSDELLLYGQWAEGFRLGRPQVVVVPACDPDGDRVVDGLLIPREIDPDSSESFELGLKWSSSDSSITANAAIYHINWEGMPVSVTASCGASYSFNAGSSRSQGLELELKAQVTENLLVNMATSYNIAELTEDAPNLGSKGDELPGSADFNLSLGLEYGFDLAGREAFARLDYSYVGPYFSAIQPLPGDIEAGGYSELNIKTGINLNNFNIDLFINNLTDADEFTWIETTASTFGFTRAYRLRPRTVGLNVNYSF